ncbi:MAG: hypothetical protein JWQ87_943 [Candidatus Sulfotelmatobacter sp.]|nr:hypothetical protein [Candidatus Sulfotelmatobacter sp.]
MVAHFAKSERSPRSPFSSTWSRRRGTAPSRAPLLQEGPSRAFRQLTATRLNSGNAPAEYRRIVQWFRAREQRRWDNQLDTDSSAATLDFVFDPHLFQDTVARAWPSLRPSLPSHGVR